MSAQIELSPWQALKSHQVNCNKGCTRKKVACPVGRLLLAKAMKEPEAAHKMKSFPFVAKMMERILAQIDGKWVEAVVYDRSILASEMYEREDWETGERHWRTAAPKIIGYEVETDDKQRHYVRPYQVKKLVSSRAGKESRIQQSNIHMPKVQETRRSSSVGAPEVLLAARVRTPQVSDLIVVRR